MKEDLYLKSLEVKDGHIDMSLTGDSAKAFMICLVELFKQNGGENFLAVTFGMNGEKYAVTIQNCNGKDSPSEKLQRYEDQAKELRKRIDELELSLGIC